MAQARHPPEKGLTEETIAALATPPGRSALGIVRLSGPDCRAIAVAMLGPAPLDERRASVRTLTRGQRIVDRVVVTFWTGPATATGEDMLEITAHGSPEILREILECSFEAGARAAAPGEFTRRAFLNGKIELSQARAVGELIAARGASARAAALARLEGGFSQALDGVRSPLVGILAHIEARLDHPDEDIPSFDQDQAAAAFHEAETGLERLLLGYVRGRNRKEGVRVGLFGRPNAGKSSLLNALLGRARAITAPEPGTTRDIIEEQIELCGTTLMLFDTAGLREGAVDPAEREGIVRALNAAGTCSVAVLVVDAANETDVEEIQRRLCAVSSQAKVIIALNKIDLLGGRAVPSTGLRCSALTGEGLGELEAAIARAAGQSGDEGEALLDDARTYDSLFAASQKVRCAREELRRRPQAWEDLAAQSLREALGHLDQARGRDASNDVLDEIFSRFCLGK
ncbi:MAG: tRNA uridine-5-carboxymethylaminomethyl(34) synthesis GTPase MnmE [Elusimicrobiota bacterium]